MKKILYIATVDISKRSGGSLAMLAYYNALMHLFPEKVHLVMPEEGCHGQYSSAIQAPRRNILQALSSGSIHRYKKIVKNHLDKHSDLYDWCIINGGIYAGDMVRMIQSYRIKVAVIHHNFEREYQMDNKTLWTFKGITPALIIYNERKAYLSANVNCFLTKKDIELFHNTYGIAKGKDVLIGVFEPKQHDEYKLAKGSSSYSVITGCLDSVQTLSGLNDFICNYWKDYSILSNNLMLVISGRNPLKEILLFEKREEGKVKILPNPINMDEVVKDARVFICPTNVGGGLKLRIMDGLRMGVPVLAHAVSARGYEMFFNSPFFKVYNDKKTFKQGLEELLTYTNKNNYSEVVYKNYLEYFSFEAGCKRMETIFNY